MAIMRLVVILLGVLAARNVEASAASFLNLRAILPDGKKLALPAPWPPGVPLLFRAAWKHCSSAPGGPGHCTSEPVAASSVTLLRYEADLETCASTAVRFRSAGPPLAKGDGELIASSVGLTPGWYTLYHSLDQWPARAIWMFQVASASVGTAPLRFPRAPCRTARSAQPRPSLPPRAHAPSPTRGGCVSCSTAAGAESGGLGLALFPLLAIAALRRRSRRTVDV